VTLQVPATGAARMGCGAWLPEALQQGAGDAVNDARLEGPGPSSPKTVRAGG
jgi:hypothetical protein